MCCAHAVSAAVSFLYCSKAHIFFKIAPVVSQVGGLPVPLDGGYLTVQGENFDPSGNVGISFTNNNKKRTTIPCPTTYSSISMVVCLAPAGTGGGFQLQMQLGPGHAAPATQASPITINYLRMFFFSSPMLMEK